MSLVSLGGGIYKSSVPAHEGALIDQEIYEPIVLIKSMHQMKGCLL